MDNIFFFFFLVSFSGFWHKSYVGMWGHYGFKIVEVFLGPFSQVLGLTIDILWWYMPSFYGRLCPICFLRSWVLVVLYLCFRFLYIW
jgi:hypothetical protein